VHGGRLVAGRSFRARRGGRSQNTRRALDGHGNPGVDPASEIAILDAPSRRRARPID
jgi:hypothetical protein